MESTLPPRLFSHTPKPAARVSSPHRQNPNHPRLFGKKYEFEIEGRGFYFEAGAVAADISRDLKRNNIKSHSETLRVLEILDEIQKQGGARFPQEAAI